tara:strand:- start:153 stop:818 length:666 start_codon:yes stop_codon:yes gene_type:complete
MNPVDPNFVKSLMENIYGNKEEIKPQSTKEAEESCDKHATTMENFGLPTNIGNGWKAPKNPQPRKQKLEDHKDEEKSLTESVDPMEKRVTNLEESLATLLTSLKSLINEGYGKKMMKEAEGPSDKELKDIEKEEKPQHHKTAVGAQGEAAGTDDEVPVGQSGQGQTQNLGKVLQNVTDPTRRKELKMKARGHKLTKKQLKSGIKKKKQITKPEIDQVVQDS